MDEKQIQTENEQTVALSPKDYISSKLSLVLVIALGALAVGAVAKLVIDALLVGLLGIGNGLILHSTIIFSPRGHMLVALVGAPLAVFIIISLVKAIKLLKSDRYMLDNFLGAGKALSALKIYALFSVIDAAIASFSFILSIFDATGRDFIKDSFDFFRMPNLYESFGMAELTLKLQEKNFVLLLLVLAVAIILIAHALSALFTHAKLSHYYSSVVDYITIGKGKQQKRPPVVMPCIFALLTVAAIVIQLIGGFVVSAIFNLFVLAYVVANELLLWSFYLKTKADKI